MTKTVKPSDLILGALATILLWWGCGRRAASHPMEHRKGPHHCGGGLFYSFGGSRARGCGFSSSSSSSSSW